MNYQFHGISKQTLEIQARKHTFPSKFWRFPNYFLKIQWRMLLRLRIISTAQRSVIEICPEIVAMRVQLLACPEFSILGVRSRESLEQNSYLQISNCVSRLTNFFTFQRQRRHRRDGRAYHHHPVFSSHNLLNFALQIAICVSRLMISLTFERQRRHRWEGRDYHHHPVFSSHNLWLWYFIFTRFIISRAI